MKSGDVEGVSGESGRLEKLHFFICCPCIEECAGREDHSWCAKNNRSADDSTTWQGCRNVHDSNGIFLHRCECFIHTLAWVFKLIAHKLVINWLPGEQGARQAFYWVAIKATQSGRLAAVLLAAFNA